MPSKEGEGSPGDVPRWFPPSELATRVLLVRHGSTEHSHEGRFSGRNELPLDAEGRRQGQALAAQVAALAPFDAIFSSPLRRARETAEVIVERTGGTVQVQPGLVETEFGDWEGLTMAEVHRKWPERLAEWRETPGVAPPGGESFMEVELRTQAALEEIIAGHQGGRIVVVSHVTPIKTLLRLALGAPPATMFRFHLDTASLSVVDYYPDGTCSVRTINRSGHSA